MAPQDIALSLLRVEPMFAAHQATKKVLRQHVGVDG
jgi:hypothetical protein